MPPWDGDAKRKKKAGGPCSSCGLVTSIRRLFGKPAERTVRQSTIGESNTPPQVAETTLTKITHKSELDIKQVNEYKFEKILGTGSYGAVYSARDKRGELVAVKVLKSSVLKKRKALMRPETVRDQLYEIAVMKRLNHPGCVQLFEVIDDPSKDRAFLIMEMLQGGTPVDKENLPDGMSYLPEECARPILRNLLSALRDAR